MIVFRHDLDILFTFYVTCFDSVPLTLNTHRVFLIVKALSFLSDKCDAVYGQAAFITNVHVDLFCTHYMLTYSDFTAAIRCKFTCARITCALLSSVLSVVAASIINLLSSFSCSLTHLIQVTRGCCQWYRKLRALVEYERSLFTSLQVTKPKHF